MFANHTVYGSQEWASCTYKISFRRVQKSAKTSATPNEVINEDSLGGNHLQILQTFGSVAASDVGRTPPNRPGAPVREES
ncbi:hypothetical protein K439DRAFT_1640153 [Ramaria rubella]|nr:hypothetical protein K439DRAFT_1640153 [Ramaria rubella]